MQTTHTTKPPTESPVEHHPLKPFLPRNCNVLFLGSFPPPKARWSMDFYYPNFINDHWRIEGLIFFKDKDYFVDQDKKTFKLDKIIDFLEAMGIGFYDTATTVRRLSGNASDKFLQVEKATDIKKLIAPLKDLKAIAVSGEKAAETICNYFSIPLIKVGERTTILKGVWLYRLPSSSRAYPMALDPQAGAYQKMFDEIGLFKRQL